ncbi:MAG TPA: lipocalin family protein [Armatimonadaceae bacterium]|nr:lipocalin family protein [Armatimonadaceae bacterium]
MAFRYVRAAFAVALGLGCLAAAPAGAQGGAAAAAGLPTPLAPPPMPARTTPVGLPQDAGPHDAATIEWWYYNAFLTTESGKRYAVVASFFRTGLTKEKKGHYLIYSLADLDAKKKTAYSVLDRSNRELLKSLMPLVAQLKPEDPKPLQLLALLQKDRLPEPHRAFPGVAKVTTAPRFSIALGEENRLEQATDDARTWKAALRGDDFALDLTLAQPDRPPMLVGDVGKTGLNRPDDMFYVSLTRMAASGTLTRGEKAEKVTGVGWLDRQWGSSWVVGDNGWDWFGVQLADGSDLIVYRIKDNATGRTLRTEATLLKPDGVQVVDRDVTFTPRGAWTDPATAIKYPAAFGVKLNTLGHALTMTPAFPDQTIPVIGIGDAIWEGVVNVTGRAKDGSAVTGRGYMELVGYRAAASSAAKKGTR